MANRTFQEKQLALIKRKVDLYAIVSVGAAGAVTLLKITLINGAQSFVSAPTTGTGYSVGNGEGVNGVSRTGTGAWTFTLSDPYVRIVGVDIARASNATGVPAVAAVGVNTSTSNVQTNTSPGSGGVVAVVLVDFAGAAVDPASGDIITIHFTLADASEP